MPKVHLPPLHPKQREVADHPARFKVIAIGRQWGKSFMAKIKCLDEAINQGKTVWWVAPTYKTASPHWREIKRMVGKAKFVRYKNEQDRYIEFDSGGSITIKSADKYDNLRGSGLDFVVLDEAAFMASQVWYEVILGALMATGGSVWFLSTPNGKNWFYDLWLLGQSTSDKNSDWMSWQLPSYTSPYVDKATVNVARQTMSKKEYKREIEAQFEDTGGSAFFGYEKRLLLMPLDDPLPQRTYVAGIDWGRRDDYTVVVIFDRRSGDQAAIYRFSQMGYTTQIEEIKKILARWRPEKCYVEVNNIGDVMFELLQNAVKFMKLTPVRITPSNKPQYVEAYALGIEKEWATLIVGDDDISAAGAQQKIELEAYQEKPSRAGYVSYEGVNGEHDDIVAASILAWSGVVTPRLTRPVTYAENPFYGD